MNTLTPQLREALRGASPSVRPQALDQTLFLAKRELRRRAAAERISFGPFLLFQARFIGWRIWLCQALAFAVLLLLLSSSLGAYYWANPRYSAMLLCCVCVPVWGVAPLLATRAQRHRMSEIEAAARFSSAKILAAQLLLSGMGSVALLGGTLAFVLRHTPLPLSSAMLYLLFPSLLTCAGMLFLLRHLPARRLAPGAFGVCLLFLLAFAAIRWLRPAFYQQSLSGRWLGLCAALALLCARQVRSLLSRPVWLELQCP